jgi:hypothetical protein
VGLGLSGIKSLDVLRDLPPLHASNSTSTTGSTAAVIIIQPITLSNVLTRLHSSRKFTGVDPQAYLTNVLTKLVNLWAAFDKLMPWAGAAERCAHKLAAYQRLRPENQAVSTGGSEICLRPSGNIAKIKSTSEQLGQWRAQIAARPPQNFVHPRLATSRSLSQRSEQPITSGLTARLKILSKQSGRSRR